MKQKSRRRRPARLPELENHTFLLCLWVLSGVQAVTLATLLSAVQLGVGGPSELLIYDIHALQSRFSVGQTVRSKGLPAGSSATFPAPSLGIIQICPRLESAAPFRPGVLSSDEEVPQSEVMKPNGSIVTDTVGGTERNHNRTAPHADPVVQIALPPSNLHCRARFGLSSLTKGLTNGLRLAWSRWNGRLAR
jgi:hypothetical protein